MVTADHDEGAGKGAQGKNGGSPSDVSNHDGFSLYVEQVAFVGSAPMHFTSGYSLRWDSKQNGRAESLRTPFAPGINLPDAKTGVAMRTMDDARVVNLPVC